MSSSLDGTLDGADIYSNLAVLAAACNANPVIVLRHPPAWVYSGLGITHESDSLNHRIGAPGLTGTCEDDVLAKIAKIEDFKATAKPFAARAAKRKSTPRPRPAARTRSSPMRQSTNTSAT